VAIAVVVVRLRREDPLGCEECRHAVGSLLDHAWDRQADSSKAFEMCAVAQPWSRSRFAPNALFSHSIILP
jgi:hypothetical protein